MGDIRTSSMGGVPFGTSNTRPANPQIGQTYYNGTLGVQEIYTSSGWLPATGANDFNVTLNGSVTTATFTKEYFAGAYTIASALLDSTYDIYVYDTNGNLAGYTKSPSLNATGNFNKIVVIGGTSGDLLSFSYKTTFTTTSSTSQTSAGAFLSSITPTSLPSINDVAVLSGGNFANNVAVYFIGSDNIERPAKSIIKNSDSQLTITRPDDFPVGLGTYKVLVENPGVTRPTGSSLHILHNAVSPGTSPNWTTSPTLDIATYQEPYSKTIAASDVENTTITYSVVSGSLPSGISLNLSSGLLSGTYNQITSSTFTIRALDAGGNYTDRQFTIPINPIVNVSSNSQYSNFQVLATIPYVSSMRTDFADLKFYQGTTPCSYWIESYTVSGSANVWINVPQIAVGNNIIRIKPDGTTNNSSGSSTFEWFEDFSSGSYGSGKWNLYNTSGFSVTSSGLPSGGIYSSGLKSGNYMLKGTNNEGAILGSSYWNGNYEIIDRSYSPSNAQNGFTRGGFGQANNAQYNFCFLDHNPDNAYCRVNNNWENGNSFNTTSTPTGGSLRSNWMRNSHKAVDGSFIQTLVDQTGKTRVHTATGTLGGNNYYGPFFGKRGDWSTYNQSCECYWDWIFIRKAAATEPAVTVS